MTTLTAAGWDERYPPGTPVLFTRADGATYADETTSNAFHVPIGEGEPLVDTVRHGRVRLADVTPLATDEQRRADGWLDPDRAAGLTRDRDLAGFGTADLRERLRDALEKVQRLAADQPATVITLQPGGRYRLVGPDGVWVVTGLSTAGDHAELSLHRDPQPPCPECGPGYRLGDEGCRHG